MKKLDPEKFKAAMEAILADEQKKQPAKPPSTQPSSRTIMPAAEFQAMMAKRHGIID
jgi:hypothetical protein